MKEIWYMILALLMLGCKAQPKEDRVEEVKVVDYREILFGVEDSLLTITPDFKKSSSNIGIQLLDTLKVDSLYQVKFNLDVGNGKLIPAYIESFKNKKNYQFTCEHCKSKFYLASDFEYVHENTLSTLKESDLGFDLSLIFFMLNKLEKDPNHRYLTLDWDIVNSSEENINSNITFLLESLEPAYYLFYERIALKRYNKPLHELEEELLYDLKSEFPYRVKLCVILPIPPPPSSLKE